MPLMYLPLIMFTGFWESMLQPFGAAPARVRAKAVTRQPRYRDIDAD
jgi:hypothetical protein